MTGSQALSGEPMLGGAAFRGNVRRGPSILTYVRQQWRIGSWSAGAFVAKQHTDGQGAPSPASAVRLLGCRAANRVRTHWTSRLTQVVEKRRNTPETFALAGANVR